MPAYSFKGEPKRGAFWRLILDGEKTMTTRKQRRHGARVEQTAYLYWKQRTPAKDKPIHLIGMSPILNVAQYPSMKALLLSLGAKGALEYIKAEGFTDLRELVEWWTGMRPQSYGIMEGGILMDEYTWSRLEESDPVEVIQWAYPLKETEYARSQ